MKKLTNIMAMLCMVFAIATAPVMGQQTVQGYVFNAQTNEPIEGADVIYDTNKGTLTDTSGTFSIPCNNSVQITISYIGYRTLKKTIRDCDMQVKVPLIPQTYSLQNITITGQTDIEEARSIGSLEVGDLNKQSGLRLKDALNTIPGVEMQTRSPFGGQRITIRGYYPNTGNNANFNGLGYQLYFNNIPVTDATGTTIMDDIDFSSLGQVEVSRGPSPLYGNEIAGTVNLFSQRPGKNGTSLSEQFIAGSYGLFRNNTSLMTRSANYDLRINYGRQSYDSFRPQDASKKDYVSASGHYQVSDNQQISAYFSYNNSDEELAGGLINDDFYDHREIANPNYVNNNGGVKIESFRAGITSYHRFNTRFDNKTTVFATGHTLDQNFAHGFNYYNSLNFGARTDFRYHQQFQKIEFDGQFGAFIQRSDESVDGVFIPPSVSPPFTQGTQPQFPTNDQNYAVNYNIFTKWSFALPLNYKISVGGIFNFNQFGIRDMLNNGSLYSGSSTRSKRFDPTFSPSASVLKSFSNKASVYASLNTGNTPPLLGDILASDGSVNDRLEPENAIQYEIGSKGRLQNDRLSYKLALFDLEINNRLATQFIDGVSFTTNIGKQRNRGIEVSLGYNVIENPVATVSKLQIWGSYTYSDLTYDQFKVYELDDNGNEVVTADFSDNEVAGVAPHRLNVGFDMQTQRGFYLHAKYKYMDKTPITFNNDTSINSYSLLSGRLGYKKKLMLHFNLDAFVGGNNLTGSTYYNFLFVGQDVDDLGDGYISPAPYNATVYGGATLSYNF